MACDFRRHRDETCDNKWKQIIKKFSEMDSRLSGGELRPLRLRKQRLENPPKETRTGRIRTRLPVTRADSSRRTTALTSPI